MPAPKNTSPKKPRDKVSDKTLLCPFTIQRDNAEGQGWIFTGLHADAAKQYRPLHVNVETIHLGTGMGDYTIKGMRDLISLERKTLSDLYGTICGWDERRPRFLHELAVLAQMRFAAVIVEASFEEVLKNPPDFGTKPPEENAKAVFGSVLSWQHQYPTIHWIFAGNKRLAEVIAFRHLERFWKDREWERKQEIKAAKIAAQQQQEVATA